MEIQVLISLIRTVDLACINLCHSRYGIASSPLVTIFTGHRAGRRWISMFQIMLTSPYSIRQDDSYSDS